jgi:alpha-amylase
VLTSLRHGEGKSGQPLIYGVSAALEVAALKARRKQQEDQGSLPSGQAAPKTRVGALGLQDAEALELAAAEMALAASSLVAAEKASTEAADAALAACDGDGAACDNAAALAQLEVMERAREEAALVLERRMAAMEAAIASRRSPKETIAEKLRQQREREMLEGFGFRAAEDGLAGGQQAGTGPGMGNGYEIILQGFQWDSHALKPSWYAHLGSRAEAISASGFTAVWLPPATNSVSEQGYLPRDLYDLNSGYGTEGALRGVLQKLKELRVKCVADIVINHRCAHTQKDGKWNQFGGRLAWDESAICQGNPAFGGTGARNTGEPYPAAPNIDHTNPKVRASLTEWLLWMRMVGFDGWRFDYVKGYSGEFTKNYVDASVPQLAFGEYWDACNYTGGVLDYNQDSHRQRTVNWCDRTGGTAAAFDFTTKGILQEAVGRSEYWRLVDSQGRMPGFAGLWGARAVTFVENHDTGPPLAHWPFPQLELAQGYAYILTHPGTPCVFWDHWDASKQPGLSDIICQLISVRKRARIHAKSTVVVLKASGECYAACIDGKVVVKLGWGDFSPNTIKLEGKHWERACNGRNFAVWTQDSVPKALSLLAAIGSAPMAGTAGR